MVDHSPKTVMSHNVTVSKTHAMRHMEIAERPSPPVATPCPEIQVVIRSSTSMTVHGQIGDSARDGGSSQMRVDDLVPVPAGLM